MASIFSKIIGGELPAERVCETENELAFLDIHPKSAGHTLVVPKLEVADFHQLPAPQMQSLMDTVKFVTRAVTHAMKTPHYNLSLNNGAPAGQIVFHVHFHIIPRYGGGAGRLPGRETPDGGLGEVGEKIRRAVRELGPPAG